MYNVHCYLVQIIEDYLFNLLGLVSAVLFCICLNIVGYKIRL